jgi:hypothetical protein
MHNGYVRNRSVPDRAAVLLIGQERRHRAKDASVIDVESGQEPVIGTEGLACSAGVPPILGKDIPINGTAH